MRKLVITSLAKDNLAKILEFVHAKWGIVSMKKLANKIDKCVDLIGVNPELFPISKFNTRIRKSVVTKQTSIFYTFNATEIKILMVFDTRQNPKKIKN